MSEVLFKCTIPGRAGILKNSKKLVRAGGRIFPVSSDKYKKWEAFAYLCIKKAKLGPTISGPVNVSMKFYFKNHAHECDLDNLFAGPNDVLQKALVIENDKLVYSFDGSRKVFDDPNERIEIEITAL